MISKNNNCVAGDFGYSFNQLNIVVIFDKENDIKATAKKNSIYFANKEFVSHTVELQFDKLSSVNKVLNKLLKVRRHFLKEKYPPKIKLKKNKRI